MKKRRIVRFGDRTAGSLQRSDDALHQGCHRRFHPILGASPFPQTTCSNAGLQAGEAGKSLRFLWRVSLSLNPGPVDRAGMSHIVERGLVGNGRICSYGWIRFARGSETDIGKLCGESCQNSSQASEIASLSHEFVCIKRFASVRLQSV